MTKMMMIGASTKQFLMCSEVVCVFKYGCKKNIEKKIEEKTISCIF